MKQDGKRELKPKLRFPEFRDVPGWAENTLGGIADFYKGKGISKAEIDPQGHLPCIRYGELYTRYGEVIEDVHSRTNAQASELFLSRKNDVIIPASGETKLDIAKASCVLRDGVALGADLNIIRTVQEGTFLSYYLNGPKRLDIAKVAQGDTVVHLYPSQLEQLPIALPKTAEQRRIASCLSSLDDVVAAQARTVDALTTYKKGLLQQLFPRDGGSIPRLRFPAFRNEPEWEERKAGDLFANRTEDGEAGLPIYSVTLNNGMAKRSSFDRDFYDIAEPAGNRKACKNDIAYNMMRMWQGAFGVAVEDCMVSPAYVVLSPQEGVVSDFFAYLLKLPRCLRLLASHSQGLTKDRLRLYYKDFARIPLLRPSMPEQQTIADFLSSIDNLIAAQTRKLNTLKTHKKGLMQQLFPASEEATE